ncbi:MAG: phage tail family protein [Bacteroidales bacterium]|nr:phage tail family protein [Bacteroidales bacterium]
MANEVQIYFNSYDLNDNGIVVDSLKISESKSVKLFNIPKSDGSIAEECKRSSLTITVMGTIIGTGYDDLRTNLDGFKAKLYNGIQKFTTDDDRYVYGQLKSFSADFVNMIFLKWSASFIVHYPFWLSNTLSSDERTPTSGVGYTINNGGNAPTRVKVTVTAPAGDIDNACQIENTTKGELFKYKGVITAAESLVVNNRVDQDDLTVENNGDDDHTNYEGDFLTLDPGDNTIEYTGTAGATVKLEYRDAWY